MPFFSTRVSGINMEKKSILLCKWEKPILFLTLEDRGGIFSVQNAEIHRMQTPKKKALPPHFASQIQFTASTLSEMWSREMHHDDKGERWGGGGGVYRDACYLSSPLRCGVYKTSSPWSVSSYTLQKRRHTSIKVCVCWHVSIGTLVAHCATLGSFVPLQSR